MDIQTIGSGSSGNCYKISDGSTAILLEAGIKFETVQQALNFKTRQIKAVFVTHEHGDHVGNQGKFVKDFLKHGLNVYMTKGTQDALRLQHHRLTTIQYREAITVGTLAILPFETDHDAAEPCGFLIKSKNGSKLLFATDTYYIKYAFKGLTHMMLEVNHDYEYMMQNVEKGIIPKSLANRIMRSHMNLENAVKYLQAIDLSQLQEVHMIHLSGNNSKGKEFKEKIQEVTGVPVKIAGG